MSPEKIDDNIWELFEGEFISGIGGEIHGPLIVRIHPYYEMEKMQIQTMKAGKDIKIEVDGLDFEAVVQKRQNQK